MSQNLPPEYKSDVVACVLAGGRAERLGGKNKGLMPWPLPESPPLVEEVLQRLRCQVGSVVINANAGIAKFEAYGYPVVSDAAELADMGPLTGIVAVGEFSSAEWVLVAAVDCPVLPLDLLARLRSCGGSIAVAHDGARLQSLTMLIHRDHVAGIRHYLMSGGRSVFGWLNKQPFKTADFSDQPEAFTNLNTHADFNISE